MFVIVKGMKIPERCAECPFRLAWCRETFYMDIRPPQCPLVELPKEHGRLIDADKLRSNYSQPNDMTDPQQVLFHITGIWAEIDCMPTIIEAEE